MNWLINKGRRRSPVKKGTLIDVVLHTGFGSFGGECVYSKPMREEELVIGTKAGETITNWNRYDDLTIGEILLWREHVNVSSENQEVPNELLEEAKLNEES